MRQAWIAVLPLAACLVDVQSHAYQHARHHNPLDAQIQSRDMVTNTVTGPTVTLYRLGDQVLDFAEVAEGLQNHKYIFESIFPSAAALSLTSSSAVLADATALHTSSPGVSDFNDLKAIQKSKSIATIASATSQTLTSAMAPSSSTLNSSTSSGNAGSNPHAYFPSGTIPCSEFPAYYGPLYIDWLGLEGWTGVQQVPDFRPGKSAAIEEIITTAGGTGGCSNNSFCSYACPPGYQKSQWPPVQGSAGQSIGGLYCNSDGILELSRPSVTQLCTVGVGNVFVQNQLHQNVAICRTDYPGLESETIPLDTWPHSLYPLTCPDAREYFLQGDRQTTAQYYVNPAGTPVDVACRWGSGGDTGNWAPVNLGVGTDKTGMTYIAMLPNAPTDPAGELNFSITIVGSVSGKCSYHSGFYWIDGQQSSSGCTVAVSGDATFVFS